VAVPSVPYEIRFHSREEEQESFRRLLRGVIAAGRAKAWSPVMVLYGIGGIGKSTLLNRLRVIAGQGTADGPPPRVVLVDWALVRQLRPAAFPQDAGPAAVTVLDELHFEACRDERVARHFRAYGKLRDRLDTIAVRAARLLLEPDGDSAAPRPGRNGPLAATVEATGASIQVVETLAALTPGVGVVVSALGSVLSAVAASTTVWGRLDGRLKPEEVRALRDAEFDLAAAFAGALRAASGRRPLVLFLDTYEIVQGTSAWLRRVMAESGPRVAWVLSGRFTADHDASTSELRRFAAAPDVSVHPLKPFDKAVLASVLAEAAPDRRPGEADLAHLMRATRGIPLAIRLVADLWRGGVPLAAIAGDEVPGRSISEVLAEQFLVHLRATGSDADLSHIFALALLRDADDADLLAALWDCDDVTGHFGALARRYDFVLARGHRLHDTIQDFLVRYLLDPFHRRQVRDANRRAVLVLERRLRARHEYLPTLARRLGDEAWVSAALALVWHRYWVDADEGWQTLRSVLPAAIVYAPSTGQAFLNVAAQFAGSGSGDRLRLARLRDMLGRTAEQRGARARQAVADLRTAAGRPGPQPNAGCEVEQAALLAVLHGRGVARTPGLTDDAVREIVAAAERMPPAVTNLRPVVARTLVALLSADLAKRDAALAVGAAELAVRLEPENAHAQRTHIGMLYQAERFAEALEVARRLVVLTPESWEAREILGEMLGQTGDLPGALVQFRRAELIDPDNWVSISNIAVALAKLGRPADEALAPLDAAVVRSPDDVDLRRSRADLLVCFGRDAEAAVDLGVVVQRQPDDLKAHDDYLRALLRLDRPATALRAYGDLLAANPEDEGAAYDVEDILYWAPSTADLADALHDMLDRCAAAPGTAPVLSVRGMANLELDRATDAERVFDQLRKLEPENLFAHLNHAAALHMLGRAAAALAACERAAGVDPASPGPYSLQTQILLGCGDLSGAETVALRAAARAPEREIDSWVLAGMLAWHDGRRADAGQRFRRALETIPAITDTMRLVLRAELLSIALLALGHRDAAFRALRHAVDEAGWAGSDLPAVHRELLAHWRNAPDGLVELRSMVEPVIPPPPSDGSDPPARLRDRHGVRSGGAGASAERIVSRRRRTGDHAVAQVPVAGSKSVAARRQPGSCSPTSAARR
jgi:tetratricopeptide (TPR) repeat protein